MNPIAPPLPTLTPAQELALLARMLHREGYDDHLAGHITYKQPDGTFLVNPFGLTWDELRASDVMHMDAEGNVLDGQWTMRGRKAEPALVRLPCVLCRTSGDALRIRGGKSKTPR